MFFPYSLLQNLLNVETNCDTAECCLVGGDVLDAPKNVELSPYGEIAEKYINQLNDFYDNMEIVRYVIMPNHIHILLFVKERGPSRDLQANPPVPTEQNSKICI